MSIINKICCFPNVLLPSDKKVDLSQTSEAVKILKTVSGLYGLSIKALENVLEEQYTSFDSLATDCSCHLRALRIAAFAQKIFNSSSQVKEEVKKTLEVLKEKRKFLSQACGDLSSWCEKGKKMSSTSSPIVSVIQTLQKENLTSSYCFNLLEILDKMAVKVDLNEEMAYAVHAYILTIVKSYKKIQVEDGIICADEGCFTTLAENHNVFKETTKLNQLTKSIRSIENCNNVNGNLIEKNVYKLAKKHLTTLSAEFIIDESKKLEDQNPHKFLTLNQKWVDGKVELPDYYSLTAVFQVCLHKNIPIILKVKKCLHAHRYQEPMTPFDLVIYLSPKEGKNFKLKHLNATISNGPVIVVEGKRSGKKVEIESTEDYSKRLMQDFNFLHFCKLDGAQHKQYTSDADHLQQMPSDVLPCFQKENYRDEAKYLNSLKQEAEEKGCAYYNQSLLIFSHIFADTIHHQLSEHEFYPQDSKWMKLMEKRRIQ